MNGDFSEVDVDNAIHMVCKHLKIEIDDSLYVQYINGYYQDFLTYHKLKGKENTIPYIQKILIAAKSYCHQPVVFYDIISTCRCVYYVQWLSKVFSILSPKNAKNFEYKCEKLLSMKNSDEFESVLYELLVAAKYLENLDCPRIEFIKETPAAKTPDICLQINGGDVFVECKRFNRVSDFSVKVRNDINDKFSYVANCFMEYNKSFMFDMVFLCEPSSVTRERMLKCCIEAAKSPMTPIVEPDFYVIAHLLLEYENEGILYPSPKFYKDRYDFEYGHGWQGLVHRGAPIWLKARKDTGAKDKIHTTWIAGLQWDCALRWKIESQNILAMYRKFTYKKIFEGIEQLNNFGKYCILHSWLERDKAVGARRDEMMQFFDKLKFSGYDLSWLVFNETDFDVSPNGYFDLIENVHVIAGPCTLTSAPPVTNLFLPDGAAAWNPGVALFGVGMELPPIDQVKREEAK